MDRDAKSKNHNRQRQGKRFKRKQQHTAPHNHQRGGRGSGDGAGSSREIEIQQQLPSNCQSEGVGAESSPTPPLNIPGFYFDPAKNRYFKIVNQGHSTPTQQLQQKQQLEVRPPVITRLPASTPPLSRILIHRQMGLLSSPLQLQLDATASRLKSLTCRGRLEMGLPSRRSSDIVDFQVTTTSDYISSSTSMIQHEDLALIGRVDGSVCIEGLGSRNSNKERRKSSIGGISVFHHTSEVTSVNFIPFPSYPAIQSSKIYCLSTNLNGGMKVNCVSLKQHPALQNHDHHQQQLSLSGEHESATFKFENTTLWCSTVVIPATTTTTSSAVSTLFSEQPMLVVGGSAGLVKIVSQWQQQRPRCISTVNIPSKSDVFSLSSNQNGRLLYSGCRNGEIWMFGSQCPVPSRFVSTASPVISITSLDTRATSSLSASSSSYPHGLVVACMDGSIRLFDIRNSKTALFTMHVANTHSFISPHANSTGRLLCCGSEGGSVGYASRMSLFDLDRGGQCLLSSSSSSSSSSSPTTSAAIKAVRFAPNIMNQSSSQDSWMLENVIYAARGGEIEEWATSTP